MTSVESITLQKNPRLSRIPEVPATSANLTRVDIRRSSELSSPPSALFEAPARDTLNAACSGLTGFPSILGNASPLRLVDVSPQRDRHASRFHRVAGKTGELRHFGHHITALPSLYYLDLSENHDRPAVRLGWTGRTTIPWVGVHLNANPITTVPESVLTSHATIDLEGTNVSPEDPVVQRADEDGSDVAFIFS